jgi:hypothetical protein
LQQSWQACSLLDGEQTTPETDEPEHLEKHAYNSLTQAAWQLSPLSQRVWQAPVASPHAP